MVSAPDHGPPTCSALQKASLSFVEVTWWQKKGPNTKAAHFLGLSEDSSARLGCRLCPGKCFPGPHPAPSCARLPGSGGGRPGLLARGIRGAKCEPGHLHALLPPRETPHAQRLSSRHFWVRTGCTLWEPSWRRCHRSSGRCRQGLKALLLRAGRPCVQGRRQCPAAFQPPSMAHLESRPLVSNANTFHFLLDRLHPYVNRSDDVHIWVRTQNIQGTPHPAPQSLAPHHDRDRGSSNETSHTLRR